jgi:hypothetical protein
MIDINTGLAEIQRTVQKIASSELEHIEKDPSRPASSGVLLRLHLKSGEVLNFSLSRHELGLYSTSSYVREMVDHWMQDRLARTRAPV